MPQKKDLAEDERLLKAVLGWAEDQMENSGLDRQVLKIFAPNFEADKDWRSNLEDTLVEVRIRTGADEDFSVKQASEKKREPKHGQNPRACKKNTVGTAVEFEAAVEILGEWANSSDAAQLDGSAVIKSNQSGWLFFKVDGYEGQPDFVSSHGFVFKRQ